MSVNLSGHQLRDRGLVDRVLAVAQTTQDRAVTPVSRDHRDRPDRRSRRRRRGDRSRCPRTACSIALDDFGTGYSTLAHLQQLRADILKIDRSFVAHVGRGTRDREIIAAVTAMAHALGMTVVGEGIEDESTRGELSAIGCDAGQGYLLAPPLPASEIPALWSATRHKLAPAQRRSHTPATRAA